MLTAIDRDLQGCRSGENGHVAYDKLLFGTGSTPFIIPLPGHDLEGVIAYRDLEDTHRDDRGHGAKDNKVVVIGGGSAGAGSCRWSWPLHGVDVTVVHIMGHLMERQLDEAAGYLLKKSLWKTRGSPIRLPGEFHGRSIVGEDGKCGGRCCWTMARRLIPADLLVMAVGIRPATRLGAG